MDTRDGALLAWQWSIYPEGHRDRRNLAVHILTVPIFMTGTCTLVLAPFVAGWPAGAWLAAGGVLGMAAAMALQGRTHRLEATPPAPFRGPLDVLSRIFAEQWITFPRFVLSGGFVRAWRSRLRR
jgi:hypothetical protein